jgi:hypothetical protein
MRIDIKLSEVEIIPEFPAFYTDDDGHLWYFDDEDNGLTINFRGDEDNDYLPGVMSFAEAESYYTMTKVVGTIAIYQD